MVKPQRLQKYIADCGICSRRKAEVLIESGKVQINGQKAKLGDKVNEGDRVMIDNKPLVQKQTDYETYLVYKPRGVTSTTADRFAERIVTELVPSKKRLFPIGRLDKESEGLIILSNDGNLAQKLSHPSFEITKTYQVKIDRPMNAHDLHQLRKGVNDGTDQLSADSIKQITPTTLVFVLHHGKKRHIRRMLAQFDYQVEELIRTHIGNLSLATLKGASYLALTAPQIDQLLSSCLKPSS